MSIVYTEHVHDLIKIVKITLNLCHVKYDKEYSASQ